MDYSMVPKFVQENYVNISPFAAKGKSTTTDRKLTWTAMVALNWLDWLKVRFLVKYFQL